MSKEAVRTFDPPKLEALVETLFLAAFADGDFGDDEQAHFRKTVETLTDGRVDDAKLRDLMTRFEAALESEGQAARLEALKAHLATAVERKVALTLAVEMTAADGIIRTSERELIMDIADGLEVDRGEAADIVKQFEP